MLRGMVTITSMLISARTRIAGPVLALMALLLLAVGSPGQALAQDCGAAGAQAGALKRQIAALGGMERQRGCRGASFFGGLFSGCGDISRRKAQAQRQLASLSSQLPAACRASRRTARDEHRSQSGWVGSNSMLFCVRLADGYYFPVPGSQFLKSGDAKLSLDQCRYICRGADVAVYKLGSPAMETEEMVSVETGRAYGELPKAFAYRDDPQFQKCDFQNYVRRVEEARARTVTPRNLENALIPVPRFKPAQEALEDQADNLPVDAAEAGQVDLAAREVRVVGPNFFPKQ